MLVLALSAVAACDVPTEAGVAPVAGPGRTIYNASTLTLGVSMTGTNKYLEEGPAYLTASVTGGTAPYRYYWYAQNCYSGSNCTAMTLRASGEGVSTANGIYVYAEDVAVRVRVIVGDASGQTWTGNSTKVLIGPAAVFQNYTIDHCLGGDDESIGYPFVTAVPPNPTTQTGKYRYNGCDLTHIWQPRP